ncbi:MAG: Asp-tRNA(Asn)/Glu-tRNA(Gln) amidotransferase subunit GatC [Planctomycetota bacterium]|nr:Asp-tRNA(Asn)/Glu-tRNA(Gln) amidotransferase subunit GatC [Planctomycetota bacterium]
MDASTSAEHAARDPQPQRSGTLVPQDVMRVAKLARLSISPEQAAAFAPQLSAFLAYAQRLASLHTEGVEPLTHVGGEFNRLQADEPGPTLPTDVLMAMAPDAQPPFIRVPKVIGDGGSA